MVLLSRKRSGPAPVTGPPGQTSAPQLLQPFTAKTAQKDQKYNIKCPLQPLAQRKSSMNSSFYIIKNIQSDLSDSFAASSNSHPVILTWHMVRAQ